MTKVGMDISQIAHLGGVASYTKNLAKRLSDSDLEMVFFYSSLRKPYKGDLKNVKQFRLPPTFFEKLFNQIRVVPIERFTGEIDIFHSSDWVQPPSKAKKVTTYHDVIPLKFPQWSHPKIVSVAKKRLKLVEREIDCVLAVSRATKNDLLEVSNIPEEKIIVIYEGVDEIFKPLKTEEVEKFRRENNLPSRFILAIGGVGSRRNLDAVKKATHGFDLVITGETIKHISDNQMPLLYGAADCLLYPSFYEGFGLPVVEAMACGTPVITSNVSALPEVGGEAVEYVDPFDTEEIRSKVVKVMNDGELRKQLSLEGLKQAKKFSWEKAAKETIKAYYQVVRS